MKNEECRMQNEKSEILVCFALKEEVALFRKITADKPNVATIVTGIGRKNAEKSLREFLATHSPELVLTCGFAGGLNPDLKLGDVIFETVNAPLAPPGGARGAFTVSKITSPSFKSGFNPPAKPQVSTNSGE